jgi:hypothetical protein
MSNVISVKLKRNLAISTTLLLPQNYHSTANGNILQMTTYDQFGWKAQILPEKESSVIAR